MSPEIPLVALQRNLGIPLPESTQWDVVSSLAQELAPIWNSLLSLAANAQVLHTDDTNAQILQRTRELQAIPALYPKISTEQLYVYRSYFKYGNTKPDKTNPFPPCKY